MANEPLIREERLGKTPAGGVRSVIFYRDENGDPIDKFEATQAEITEYDAQGNVVMRTYAELTDD